MLFHVALDLHEIRSWTFHSESWKLRFIKVVSAPEKYLIRINFMYELTFISKK